MVPSSLSSAEPVPVTSSISSKPAQVKKTIERLYSRSRVACMARHGRPRRWSWWRGRPDRGSLDPTGRPRRSASGRRAGRPSAPSRGGSGQEPSQPHQIVSGGREGEGEVDPRQPAKAGLLQAGDRLDPAERLLDPLADALALGIAGMPAGAAVDRPAPAAAVFGGGGAPLSLAPPHHEIPCGVGPF